MVKREVPSFISLLKRNTLLRVENAVAALGGSEALYEKLVGQATRLIPSHIESMDGFLGESCDLPAFGISVHGMKGLLTQMGCQSLAMEAESLEMAAKAGGQRYCYDHYASFRENLLHFHEGITAVLPDMRAGETRHCGSITDYYDALRGAREAAEDYDCISAAERISQLTSVNFGNEVDSLVSEAVHELDLFRPEQALDYIIALINICETLPGVKRGE